MDAKKRLDYFGEILQIDRPSQTVRTKKDGTHTTVFDDDAFIQNNPSEKDFAPEKLIQKMIHKHVDPDAAIRIENFSRFFFSHFFRNRQYVYETILQEIGRNNIWNSQEYLSFFQHMLEDAAIVGFPSLYQQFFSEERKEVQSQTGHSLFDVRNILALRIYLADIINQTIEIKRDELNSLQKEMESTTDEETQKKILQKVTVLFGSMPKIVNGIVRYTSVPQQYMETTLPHLKDRGIHYRYDRNTEIALYLPDKERTRALLEVGQLLGRSSQASRRETFSSIGKLTSTDFEKIFPDFINPTLMVDDNQKKRVELAFGLDYETAKHLLKGQVAV